jgi:hypothetical protein
MLKAENKFAVGLVDERICIGVDASDGLKREDALNLAAWILAVADAPLAFEHVTVRVGEAGDGVLSAEFVELLARVQFYEHASRVETARMRFEAKFQSGKAEMLAPRTWTVDIDVLRKLGEWCNAQPGAVTFTVMQTVDVDVREQLRSEKRGWQLLVFQHEAIEPRGPHVIWHANVLTIEEVIASAVGFLERQEAAS